MHVPAVLVLVLVIALLLLLVAAVFARFFHLWVQSLLAGAQISLVHLVAMRFRRVDPKLIVENRIKGIQAGLGPDHGFTTYALESHYLAGGDVSAVVSALVAAQRDGLSMNFDELAALDLAGHDVVEAVKGRMLAGVPAVADTEIPSAGTITLEGKRLRAVSLSGAIAAGEPIQIVSVGDEIAIVARRSG